MNKLTVEGFGTVEVETGKRLVLAIEQNAMVEFDTRRRQLTLHHCAWSHSTANRPENAANVRGLPLRRRTRAFVQIVCVTT